MIIIAVITANVARLIKKCQDSFENISKLSVSVLILGQFFILFILLAALAHTIYIVYIAKDLSVLYNLLKTNYVLYDNAAAGLCVIWAGSLFIDYIDKNKEKL